MDNIAYKLLQYAEDAEERATAIAAASTDHGPRHWRDVARVGLAIAKAEPTVNPTVMFLFACLHDTQRLSETYDPEHGARAVSIWAANERTDLLDVDGSAALVAALVAHDGGHVIDDPTIGACWDADRLTIGRVGIVPDPQFISLPGIRADFSAWVSRAEAIRTDESPPTWTDIAGAYEGVIHDHAAAGTVRP